MPGIVNGSACTLTAIFMPLNIVKYREQLNRPALYTNLHLHQFLVRVSKKTERPQAGTSGELKLTKLHCKEK